MVRGAWPGVHTARCNEPAEGQYPLTSPAVPLRPDLTQKETARQEITKKPELGRYAGSPAAAPGPEQKHFGKS